MSNKVLASIEDATRTLCVDIFVRADGTFGFEAYRANLDSGVGWESLARFSCLTFASGEDALREAQRVIPWLDPSETWHW
ncbi:MAG: hypothetical protein AB7U73_23620 [Pirellulales bacterium]